MKELNEETTLHAAAPVLQSDTARMSSRFKAISICTFHLLSQSPLTQ